MTDHLEGLVLAEARKQGRQPNQDAIRQAGIDLAGAQLTPEKLIQVPGRGVIAPADFVRDLHERMPHAFTGLDEEAAEEATSTSLTERMRREITATRRQRALPSDWLTVRSKATGVTALHMAERQETWK